MKASSLCVLATSLASLASIASTPTSETWELRMTLDVPRVFDNFSSLGIRRYQRQDLRGLFTVACNADDEPTVSFSCLENLTHMVGGEGVSYSVFADDVLWHGIGSNLTGDFDTRSVSFSLVCEPSYAVGTEPTDDNSIVITVSGKGRGDLLQGYAAGTHGCGCAEYGHVSPTRIWQTSCVGDTAAVYGRWKARRIR